MKIISIFLFTFLIAGCQSTFGPSALSNTHIPYNHAISNTLNQQMLLNLVRLKYHDEAYFLKVSAVTASLSIAGNLGMNSGVDLGSRAAGISPNIGVSYNDRPTISYQPLQGEDYFKSIFSYIPLSKLFILTATGWSINDVFGLGISEINGIGNAITASGLTPKLAPEYQKFERLLSLLNELSNDGHLKIGPSSEDPKIGILKFTETFESLSKIEEVMRIVGLPVSTRLVKSSSIEYLDLEKPANNNTLNFYTRSISSILFYLSHNVQVPQEHLDKGLVINTKTAGGQVFDWSQTPGGKLFSIKSSNSYPDNAFLAVPYNDYWYYIAENDLQSKSTFMLLMQLFDYQSGRSKSTGPVLTIPVR